VKNPSLGFSLDFLSAISAVFLTNHRRAIIVIGCGPRPAKTLEMTTRSRRNAVCFLRCFFRWSVFDWRGRRRTAGIKIFFVVNGTFDGVKVRWTVGSPDLSKSAVSVDQTIGALSEPRRFKEITGDLPDLLASEPQAFAIKKFVTFWRCRSLF
jgi:hypothetical protein